MPCSELCADLTRPGPLPETELWAGWVGKGRGLTGSSGRKGGLRVGQTLTGLGGAGSAKEVLGTVVGWMLLLPGDVCTQPLKPASTPPYRAQGPCRRRLNEGSLDSQRVFWTIQADPM